MENNSLPIRTQRKFWTLSRLENVVCAILHSWPDLAVVKVEDSSRSQVLTGAVKESTILPASLAMTHMYEFHLRSGVCLRPNSISIINAASSRGHPFIMTAVVWGPINNGGS